MITYPCWGLKLTHISKRRPWQTMFVVKMVCYILRYSWYSWKHTIYPIKCIQCCGPFVDMLPVLNGFTWFINSYSYNCFHSPATGLIVYRKILRKRTLDIWVYDAWHCHIHQMHHAICSFPRKGVSCLIVSRFWSCEQLLCNRHLKDKWDNEFICNDFLVMYRQIQIKYTLVCILSHSGEDGLSK